MARPGLSGAQEVLRDLIDMALSEDLAEVTSRARAESGAGWLQLAPHECRLRVPLPGGDELVFRARPGWPRSSWRLSRPPVLRVPPNAPPYSLEAHDLLASLAELLPGARCWPALPAVLADLALALRRAEVATRAAPGCVAAVARSPESLIAWERLAALRDRPFHPTARVRSGWTDADHDRYGPEWGRILSLEWVAVRRDCIRSGSAGPGPGDEAVGVLPPEEAGVLRNAMEEAGLDHADHLALPTHPWQRRHILPARFASELATRLCTPLPTPLGSFVATSSVRTLAPAAGGNVHLKLPLGVSSLGALRLLPPRYLHNGGEGQRLLAEVVARHPLLAVRLRWCDERSWWTFQRPGVPEDVAGHLGCLVRRYPLDLADDQRCTLVPLAALGVTTPDGAAPALAHLGRLLDRGTTAVLEAVARALTEVALWCFAAGVMPEVHGQNVVLAVRDGGVAAVLLRDHDTVRIHPPWVRRSGLGEPGYIVAPGTRNTLVNDTPEALLSWFQTLAVQVALAAAVEADATALGHDGTEGWEAVAAGVTDALDHLELPGEAARVARRQLLHTRRWPAKVVLAPLLERDGPGGGSMPSARGEAENPLLGHRLAPQEVPAR